MADLFTVQAQSTPAGDSPKLGKPTVIVDDVHVVYRVFGGGKKGGPRATSNSAARTPSNAWSLVREGRPQA